MQEVVMLPRINVAGSSWVWLARGIALAGLLVMGCLRQDSGRGALQGQPKKSVGVLLREAVNGVRAYHDLSPIDLEEVPVIVPRGHQTLPAVSAIPEASPYAVKTDLFYVLDRKQMPSLIHWIAVAKDGSRAFVLGECARPEDITAFLAYEGKASRGYFRPSEALAFMDFWASCLPVGYDFEAIVLMSMDDLRRLYLLSGHPPDRAERLCVQMRKAMQEAGVSDVTPRVYELDGFRHYEMRFFAADTVVNVLYETTVRFCASSYPGDSPEIEAFSVRAIGEHPTPLERLKQKQREVDIDQEQVGE
jgi:hypothetical protein